MRMKKQALTDWVKALRSGEYRQGSEHLQSEGEFCCLGVLCEVAIKGGADVRVAKSGDGSVSYDGAGGFPPRSVCNWAGWDGEGQGDFAMWNDQEGLLFDEIADRLESEIQTY